MDMEETELFAFYGSLRRGMGNYAKYKSALEYIETRRIEGFELYSLGEYPYAVKSHIPGASIVIEIFRIRDSMARRMIHELEIGADYFFDMLELDDRKIGIYLFSQRGNDIKVESGDWVSFFCKSGD